LLLSDRRNICSTFFACAKKAQPILMRKFPLLNISSAKIGSSKPNFLEHFVPNNKQSGINRVGWSPDADQVTEMN